MDYEKAVAIACIVGAGLVIIMSIALSMFFVNKDEAFIKKYSKRISMMQLVMQMFAIALFIRAFLSMKGFMFKP